MSDMYGHGFLFTYAVNLIVSAYGNYMFLIYEAAAATQTLLVVIFTQKNENCMQCIPDVGFHSQACACSWNLGLA